LLSCRHHPDVGGATEARRFVDIQHAYEVLIGRSRGKEVERGASAGGGWSFHDWCARDGAMCAAAVNTLERRVRGTVVLLDLTQHIRSSCKQGATVQDVPQRLLQCYALWLEHGTPWT